MQTNKKIKNTTHWEKNIYLFIYLNVNRVPTIHYEINLEYT